MLTRAILVHDLAQARTAAAAAAELGVAATLTTAPGAAAYLGAGWAGALNVVMAREFPQARVQLVLDCGAQAGHVLAALREGVALVRFTGRKVVAAKLAEIAAAQGAELLTGRLQALDLAQEADPAAACRHWLARP